MRSDSELTATALLAQAQYMRRVADDWQLAYTGAGVPLLVAELREEAQRCDYLALRAIRADVERGAVAGALRAKVG
jgi:hypothetical protein